MGLEEKKKLLNKLITEANNVYLSYHAKRFEVIVEFIHHNSSTDSKILDIGNSPITEILAQVCGVPIDQIGFAEDARMRFGNRYKFDLNDCHDISSRRSDLGTYDIIIFAEVLEHLYTSPTYIFDYLSSLLADGGKLILQTPNACSLDKRMTMLLWMNPYMLIRENRFNPWHFREYTKKELVSYFDRSDLEIISVSMHNYFDLSLPPGEGEERSKRYKLTNFIFRCCPWSFQLGMTFTASKKRAI